MRRIHVVLSLALVGAACTGGQSTSRPIASDAVTTATFALPAVPWSLSRPAGWYVLTGRTRPDPLARTGILKTTVANVAYTFGFDSPGPNSGAGASRELSTAGVVVTVDLYWFPADELIHWDPPDTYTAVGPPTVWHDDAQNPGWRFRERRVCLGGSECVHVLEWHGPDATAEAVGQGEVVAESVTLNAGWADSMNQREVVRPARTR